MARNKERCRRWGEFFISNDLVVFAVIILSTAQHSTQHSVEKKSKERMGNRHSPGIPKCSESVWSSNCLTMRPSMICQGRGVFATRYLPQGTCVLFDHDEKVHLGHFNDADFGYPERWTDGDLDRSFGAYQSHPCRNNVEFAYSFGESAKPRCLLVLTDVRRGQELCRRYGLLKWCLFLGVECAAGKFGPPEETLAVLRRVSHRHGLDLDVRTTK